MSWRVGLVIPSIVILLGKSIVSSWHALLTIENTAKITRKRAVNAMEENDSTFFHNPAATGFPAATYCPKEPENANRNFQMARIASSSENLFTELCSFGVTVVLSSISWILRHHCNWRDQTLCPTGQAIRLYMWTFNDDLLPGVALLFIQFL